MKTKHRINLHLNRSTVDRVRRLVSATPEFRSVSHFAEVAMLSLAARTERVMKDGQ